MPLSDILMLVWLSGWLLANIILVDYVNNIIGDPYELKMQAIVLWPLTMLVLVCKYTYEAIKKYKHRIKIPKAVALRKPYDYTNYTYYR